MTSGASHAPRLFRAAGMVLALAVFSIAVFGFSPFYFGYWNVEPIVLAMLAGSALLGLWLFAGSAAGWVRIRIPRGNMLLYAWLAWMAWQTLCTLLAQNPWRSWFGPPEQGEGLAWFVACSLLMLVFTQLWPSVRFRSILFGYSFVLMFALACVHFFSDENSNLLAGFIFTSFSGNDVKAWMPFIWPDYLGGMAAWWWLAFMLAFPKARFSRLCPVFACLLFVLLASSNRLAFGLTSYAMLISLVVKWVQERGFSHFSHVSNTWRRLAMLCFLLPLAWLVVSPLLPADYKGLDGQSIPARVLINHMSLRAVADEPSRLALGKGWGQYEDDFFKYGLIRDVRVYEDGRHNPNWDMIRGYNYHSHNMAAETLLSLGIVGLMLWTLLPIIAVQGLPQACFWPAVPMLVAGRVLAGLWFAMPQSMPFQALCWFLLIGLQPAGDRMPLRRRYGVAMAALAAALMCWSAAGQYRAIRYDMALSDPFGERYGHALTVEDMKEDIVRGGDRLRANYIQLNKRMARFRTVVGEKHVILYGNYIEAMEALAADPRTGAYNASALLYGYNALITQISNPLFDDLQAHVSASYFPQALRHTERAPDREDIIAPFMKAMENLKGKDADAKRMQVVHELLAIYPAHRSALWLGGKVLSQQPGYEAEGREMMRAALSLGADRVYLITDKEIEAVRGSASDDQAH